MERLFLAWDKLTKEGAPHEKLTDAMDLVFSEGPEISLSLRLIKQAEELEREAYGWPEDKYTECSHVRESILESAKELRQRAQELDQGDAP